MPMDEPEAEARGNCDGLQRHVGPTVSREADDDDRTARAHELREALERSPGIHVVERRDADDGVERLGFERDIEKVAVHPVDRQTVVSRSRSVENRPIRVEPDDVRHARRDEFRAQNAVAATHVEDTRGATRQ